MNSIDILNQCNLNIDNKVFHCIFKLMKDDFVFKSDDECCLKLVADDEILKINSKYRGKNSFTDVISFPCEIKNIPFKGDIIIDVNIADQQKGNKNLNKEIYELFIHGLLHLAGMDHLSKKDREKMNLYEIKYKQKLEELLKQSE